jgi:hypothetical protein
MSQPERPWSCPPWAKTMNYFEAENNNRKIFREENKEERKLAEW